MTTLSGTIKNYNVKGTVDVVAATTFKGGGQVLFKASDDEITVNGSSESLTNVNETLSGQGGLFGSGSDDLLFTNDQLGIVDASVAKATFTVETYADLVNNGLMEATGGGILDFLGQIVDASATGKIEASGAKSVVEIDGGQIEGGTLATAGGGVIEFMSVDNLGYYTAAKTGLTDVTGKLVVEDGATVTIEGDIVNSGSITLDATGKATTLELSVDDQVTLSGGGTIVLEHNVDDFIVGYGGAVLTNTNDSIVGGGYIKSETNVGFDLTNGKKGLIDGNDDNLGLTLRTGATLTNDGTLEATLGGTLLLYQQTVQNSSTGVIKAIGAGSLVELYGSTIEGGTLASSSHGSIYVLKGLGDSLLDGGSATVINTGAIVIDSGATLGIDGLIDNSGSISLAAFDFDDTVLDIAAGEAATLSGGGKILLEQGAGNELLGNSGATLTNVNDTISGAGEILGAGTSAFTLINEKGGVIDSTFTSTALTIGAFVALTNDGILEADGGLLNVEDNVVGTGSVKIGGGGTATFNGAFDQNTTFLGAGTLSVQDDPGGDYTGVVSGFGTGDVIHLKGLYGPGGATDYQGKFVENKANTGGVLSIYDTVQDDHLIYSLKLMGHYASGNFSFQTPTISGTTITYKPT